MKELLRKAGTRAGCQVGRLPGVEVLGAHLADAFRRLKVNVVLDVGAHVGQYGRFLRNVGYQGVLVSFEPVLANFAALEQRRAGDPRWSAHRLALGDQEGLVPINVARLTQFSSFLVPSGYSHQQFGSLSEVTRTEMVEMRRLDRVLDDVIRGVNDPRIFLKLDTQGYDLNVLKGAGDYLELIVALQSELAVKPIYQGVPGYMEALSCMHAMGFELSGMFPVLRDQEFRVVELDSVMVRSRPPRRGSDRLTSWGTADPGTPAPSVSATIVDHP